MGTFSTAGLSNIFLKRDSKRMRESSYDRTGGNDDRIYIKSGDTAPIADIKGAGLVTHIWMTLANDGFTQEKYSLRKALLRFYWDNEENPSVEAPAGDFFGMGHGMTRNFVSAPLQMSPQDGKALNCWFPMPFAERALLTVTNECESTLIVYYYVDYELMPGLPDSALRFHAQWRRQNPTGGREPEEFSNHREYCFGGQNRDGKDNYVLMEAEGAGHYVGANINIHNLGKSALWDWPGEGDDMFFIDGEPWPPRLHGTGTEDYVNMAWCPTQSYAAPYHGLILGGDDNWKGKISYYRYHIQDPVMFTKSIRATIEHGHANHRRDDISSTAYWYQTEPHKKFDPLPPVEGRLPIDEEKWQWGDA
ncbi:MAG: DUF2961 domain-containing protein [Treponema sp.]|jgi:hypothetical protein|nr:DUF2961 domain-containing protein [Treponema sp.]